MLLVFDIGNTNIVVGAFDGITLKFELRLKTDRGRTIDEYTALLTTLFNRKLGQEYRFSSCIISSVVPPVTPDVIRFVKEEFKLEPMVVGPGLKTGIAINAVDPRTVGSDRIVNAVAAKEMFGAPALVVDFGTATSFDYVSKSGCFEGGIIAPGMIGALESLVSNTAKLPRIELAWPESAIGKDTVSAMQIGAVVGYTCLVDGLVEKVIKEVGPIEHVIATGGLGRLVSKHSSKIKHYEPYLTLHGLRIIAGNNR